MYWAGVTLMQRVDVVIIGFPGNKFTGRIAPALMELVAYGDLAIRHLLDVIEGRTTDDVETLRGELTPRGSTGPARTTDGPRGPRRRTAAV